MTKPKTHKKPARRNVRLIKKGVAADAISEIEHGTDTYILTYGQFSLIDALAVILDQTGPADVVVSSWTAADAHLEETAGMMESMSIRNFRMIVDRSFRGRQPAYYDHMRRLFGPECIRAIRSHAKFLVVSNENWKIVVRTSMNLNENPRFENIEISEDADFAGFMLKVVDAIFLETPPDEDFSKEPELSGIDAKFPFIKSTQLKMEGLNVPETTHTT